MFIQLDQHRLTLRWRRQLYLRAITPLMIMLQAKYRHPRRQFLAQGAHIQFRLKYRIDLQHRLQYIVVLKEHLPPVAPYLAIQALTLQSLAQIQHIRVFSRLHYLHQVHHYSLRRPFLRVRYFYFARHDIVF